MHGHVRLHGRDQAVSLQLRPLGWAVCNGSLLPIAQNQALFSLIGTTFGGDGQTNFALPDLRSKVPFAPGQQGSYCIAVQGVYPQRN
jgi:microcystin-dependent protein